MSNPTPTTGKTRNKRNAATKRGWRQPLAFPIPLRDGHTLETMAQAVGLMTMRLPKQRQLKPVWQQAAAMLMDAHATGCPDDLLHATTQLHRALDFEGWAK